MAPLYGSVCCWTRVVEAVVVNSLASDCGFSKANDIKTKPLVRCVPWSLA